MAIAAPEWNIIAKKDTAILALGPYHVDKSGQFQAIIKLIWRKGSMEAPDGTLIAHSDAIITGSCFKHEAVFATDLHFAEGDKKIPELTNMLSKESKFEKPEAGSALSMVLEAVCPPQLEV